MLEINTSTNELSEINTDDSTSALNNMGNYVEELFTNIDLPNGLMQFIHTVTAGELVIILLLTLILLTLLFKLLYDVIR